MKLFLTALGVRSLARERLTDFDLAQGHRLQASEEVKLLLASSGESILLNMADNRTRGEFIW